MHIYPISMLINYSNISNPIFFLLCCCCWWYLCCSVSHCHIYTQHIEGIPISAIKTTTAAQTPLEEIDDICRWISKLFPYILAMLLNSHVSKIIRFNFIYLRNETFGLGLCKQNRQMVHHYITFNLCDSYMKPSVAAFYSQPSHV